MQHHLKTISDHRNTFLAANVVGWTEKWNRQERRSLITNSCFNYVAFVVQFKCKRYINYWLYFTLFSFTNGHFACVYTARKLIIFHNNSWLSFQKLCRLLPWYQFHKL